MPAICIRAEEELNLACRFSGKLPQYEETSSCRLTLRTQTIRWPRSGTGILVMLKARLEVEADVGASKGAEGWLECDLEYKALE